MGIKISHPHKGQALMEFGLALPIMLLILVGGASMGLGMFNAQMTSDAIRTPALRKYELASKGTAVTAGELQTLINGSALRSSLGVGNYVDRVSILNASEYTSVIVGEKNFAGLASFVPGLTIRATQPINRALLQRAYTGGGTARPVGTPWVPGGTPNIPPWEGGTVAGAAAAEAPAAGDEPVVLPPAT